MQLKFCLFGFFLLSLLYPGALWYVIYCLFVSDILPCSLKFNTIFQGKKKRGDWSSLTHHFSIVVNNPEDIRVWSVWLLKKKRKEKKKPQSLIILCDHAFFFLNSMKKAIFFDGKNRVAVATGLFTRMCVISALSSRVRFDSCILLLSHGYS